MRTEERKIFSGSIPVARPWFTEEEENLVLQTLRSGWVAQGPTVKAFENEIASYTGASHAIAVNSCTSALHLCLQILGIGPGDEVILPSFTFVATANAVIETGGRPVFADIDPSTYNVDPQKVEKLITSKTKLILAVDQIGLPADLEALHAIAKKHGLKVLEDAACSLGSEYQGKKIGNLSELTCFSFHPRKVITTGEGGMITTSNAEYAKALRMKASHGASISDLARHQSSQIVFEEYQVIGHNFRMSDIQAAVGIAQLKKFPEILSKRRFLGERYNQKLGQLAGVRCPAEPQGMKFNYQTYMIRILPHAKISRDPIMAKLHEARIATRRGVMAVHLEPAYVQRFGKISLPETEAAFHETLILPLYPQMTLEEQDYVIDCLREILA